MPVARHFTPNTADRPPLEDLQDSFRKLRSLRQAYL
jgi:hypothetical protein